MSNILLSILFISIYIISCTNESSKNQVEDPTEQLEIKFSLTHPDSFNLTWKGMNVTSAKSNYPIVEEIKDFPEKYVVKETFHVALQWNQYFFGLVYNDNETYVKIKNQNTKTWFDSVKAISTERYVDCIISFCRVEDSLGNDYAIFDTNNDEDFSNDPILEYEDRIFHLRNRDINVKSVQSIVLSDFFDGKDIQTEKFAVGHTKFGKNMDKYTFSLLKMEIGNVNIDGKEYLAGIHEGIYVEYSKYATFWVDTNQNNKYDNDDVLVKLDKPFELFGRTYELGHIDRFGKSLVLKKSESHIIQIFNYLP